MGTIIKSTVISPPMQINLIFRPGLRQLRQIETDSHVQVQNGSVTAITLRDLSQLVDF